MKKRHYRRSEGFNGTTARLSDSGGSPLGIGPAVDAEFSLSLFCRPVILYNIFQSPRR